MWEFSQFISVFFPKHRSVNLCSNVSSYKCQGHTVFWCYQANNEGFILSVKHCQLLTPHVHSWYNGATSKHVWYMNECSRHKYLTWGNELVLRVFERDTILEKMIQSWFPCSLFRNYNCFITCLAEDISIC